MYSQMFSKTKLSTPQPEIGEIVQVLVANSNYNPVIPSTQGDFVLTGTVQNKADYPLLFEKIGYVGASYVSIANNNIGRPRALVYGQGLFVLGAGTAAITIFTSTDGVSWTSRFSGGTGGLFEYASYGNGNFVIYGSSISGGLYYTSTNAITWTQRTFATTSQINALTYGNGLFLHGGAGGFLRSSTDGITWDSRTSGTTSTINALTYGNGLYVYAGNGGVLRTSTDGITWDSRTSGTTSQINALTYGNGKYVYINLNRQLFTSTDAITWDSTTSKYGIGNRIDIGLRYFNYHNGLFYGSAGGTVGTPVNIFTYSEDALTWKIASSLTTTNSSSDVLSIANGNGRTLMCTFNNTVITTTLSTINDLPGNSPLYNPSTQFYIPPYNAGTTDYTSPVPFISEAKSIPTFRTYIRAK